MDNFVNNLLTSKHDIPLYTVFTTNTPLIITIVLLLSFFALLCFAISLAFTFYTCRVNSCWIKYKTSDVPAADQYMEMVNMVLTEGIWPLAFIFAGILTLIIFALYRGFLPFTPSGQFPLKDYAIIFVIIFLTFYGLLSFTSHHMGRPLRARLLQLLK